MARDSHSHVFLTDFEADYKKKMGRRCIYRCPYGLTTIKGLENIHVPELVSIGPYHSGREHVQAMQFHKRKALYTMLTRTHEAGAVHGCSPHSPVDAQKWLEVGKRRFMDSLREIEEELKDCYRQLGPEWSSSEAFLEMMLLDSCFVLELLLSRERSDPIFGTNGSPYIRATLLRDMLLLENQIPLLALTCLIKNLGITEEGVTDLNAYLNKLIVDFLDLKLSQKPELGRRKGLHVLDVYRECLIQSRRREYKRNNMEAPRRIRDVFRKYIPPSSCF